MFCFGALTPTHIYVITGYRAYEESPGIHVLEVDFCSIWTNLALKLIPFLRLVFNLRGIATTPSVVLGRVMRRGPRDWAAFPIRSPRPWTKRWETVAYSWLLVDAIWEGILQDRDSSDLVACIYGVSRMNVISSRRGSIDMSQQLSLIYS